MCKSFYASTVRDVSYPFENGVVHLCSLSLVLTVFAMVDAMNMVDGMDGLGGGKTSISLNAKRRFRDNWHAAAFKSIKITSRQCSGIMGLTPQQNRNCLWTTIFAYPVRSSRHPHGKITLR